MQVRWRSALSTDVGSRASHRVTSHLVIPRHQSSYAETQTRLLEEKSKLRDGLKHLHSNNHLPSDFHHCSMSLAHPFFTTLDATITESMHITSLEVLSLCYSVLIITSVSIAQSDHRLTSQPHTSGFHGECPAS